MTLPGCRWSGISLKNERKTVVSTNAAQTVSAIRPSSIPNQRMATDSDQIRFVTYFFTRLPCLACLLGFLGCKLRVRLDDFGRWWVDLIPTFGDDFDNRRLLATFARVCAVARCWLTRFLRHGATTPK